MFMFMFKTLYQPLYSCHIKKKTDISVILKNVAVIRLYFTYFMLKQSHKELSSVHFRYCVGNQWDILSLKAKV